MQLRDTWVNPWYRNLDNWWSKPILMLWMLRASFAALWDPGTSFAHNELAARLPFALTAIAGAVLHFDWVRRLFGRSVGVLAAVVLLTAPQYLLIGRQVMADMPFLVAYAAGLGYLAVGLFTARPVRAAGDAPWGVKVRAFFAREWPFVAFWSLQALAVLSKGFVGVTLVVIVLAGYFVVTFRWRDYEALGSGRRWWRYVLWRGGVAAAVLGLGRSPSSRCRLSAVSSAPCTRRSSPPWRCASWRSASCTTCRRIATRCTCSAACAPHGACRSSSPSPRPGSST